ncbi:MAG: hypothetical protein ABI091_25900, partial [Ferruginibacter sp.]
GCSTNKNFALKIKDTHADRQTGTEFFKTVVSSNWQQRDSLAVVQILQGNIPQYIKKFVPVHSTITDSNGIMHHAVFYVCPDYLSIGTNEDFARIPLSPMAAQKIADSFNCFLPTRKMVDLIYQQAILKLEPVPMYAFRDSSITMWQHNLIIEGQLKGRKGLIAGIKKDLVISAKLLTEKPHHEAIYGWHRLNGIPIQPLYTGHINWWVDYSHGIRLIYRKIKVDGKQMDYTAVLASPVYQKLLCDEDNCSFYKYDY